MSATTAISHVPTDHKTLLTYSAIQVRARDDVISCASDGGDGHELRGVTTRSGQGTDSAFQRSHTLLEDILE